MTDRDGRDPTPSDDEATRILSEATRPSSAPPVGGAPDIPGFELAERIGSGGMGEVWSAEQREGIRRRVAIKLIRPGLGTERVVARFEAERQALALMDHPAIAGVHGAGTTGDGRPYVVMELVRGERVDVYCDRHRLGIRDRLELFLKICEGVQHAHQKAVLHRDLKPSNILVTRRDGGPQPKIIDFGLAKATAQPLTEESLYTRLGEVLGTPEYMSPEQADPNGGPVDTRTDVYALGVVLYLLLVGALPFDRELLQRDGMLGLQRVITTVDPPRPSVRLSRMGEGSELAAENRRSDLPALTRDLRGDLDWIVMKAVEKSPGRRYASVDAFAADIRRYLEDRAVEARPPTVGYRVRKYVRRHRVGVVATTSVFVALLLGTAFATLGLVRSRAAERTATREARIAEQVTGFLVDLFDVSDPSEARGRSVTAREILQRGAERVDELADSPLVAGRLQHTLGRVHSNLGLYEDAQPLLEASVEALRGVDGDLAEAELSAALHSLGVLHDTQGRYEEAETLFRENLVRAEARRPSDDEALGRALNSLAIVRWNQGDLTETESLLRRALEVRERRYGEESLEVSKTLNNLGTLASTRAELDEAEGYFLRALAIEREVEGADHPDVAGTLNNLGSVYQQQRRFPEARDAFEKALSLWERVLGKDHADVGIVVHNLGDLAQAEGNPELSFPLYERSRRIFVDRLGGEHIYVATSYQAEASARRSTGDLGRAEELYRRSIATWEAAVGPDHPALIDPLEGLAEVLEETGQEDAGVAIVNRLAALRSSTDS